MTDQELLTAYARIFDDPVDDLRRAGILAACRIMVEAPTHAAAVEAVAEYWGADIEDPDLWRDVAELRRAAGVGGPDPAAVVQTVRDLVAELRAGRVNLVTFAALVREAVGA